MKCPGCNSSIPKVPVFSPECGQKIEMDFSTQAGLTGDSHRSQKRRILLTKKQRRLPKKNRNGYGTAPASLVIFIGCAIAVTLNNRQNSNKVPRLNLSAWQKKTFHIYRGLSLRER